MSWPTDMSPTATLGTADPCTEMYTCGGVGGGVYPGYGTEGWVGRGYTGTPPTDPPGPHIEHILALSPTHGQMKPKLRYL